MLSIEDNESRQDVDSVLQECNEEASRNGIKIRAEKRGCVISLRGTFPPKVEGDPPKQSRISTGIKVTLPAWHIKQELKKNNEINPRGNELRGV